MSGISVQAVELGDILYDEYMKQQGEGCGQLVIDWAKDRFYGRLVESHIPMFDTLWNKLTDNGRVSYDSGLSYGDMDNTLWAERLNDKERIIICVNHCTCSDTPVTILRFKDYPLGDEEAAKLGEEHAKQLRDMFTEFRVDMVWSDEVKRVPACWGDHRDIIKPSLQTFRDCDFDYGYGDGRDNCHSFKFRYSHKGPNVDKASWHEGNIVRALDDLKWWESMFDYELENE